MGFLANASLDGGTGSWDVAGIFSSVNSTGQVISGFEVSYTAFQYRKGGSRDSAIGFFYRIDGGAWTELSEALFVAPNTAATPENTQLSPPLSAERALTVAGLSVQPDSTFDFAWRYQGTLSSGSGSHQDLAVGDVSITTVPEARFFALGAGALVLLFTVSSRRPRAQRILVAGGLALK
ncbi:MAG: hypothetical protein EA353_09040 [Puniceicoccaceae bacterium]|nr:MAG: hypothetical protein EA353_09040 [Puniceicoccaceae bacterium]